MGSTIHSCFNNSHTIAILHTLEYKTTQKMRIILVSLISVVTGGGVLSANETNADYKYLFDGCCRGKAKPVRAAGDMSHAKCAAECKKEPTCIAIETAGWNKKSGQYGSCYLFKDSGKKEITNGGCNTSGDKKCFEKIDEKEEEEEEK